MKRKVELTQREIRHIVETFGNAWAEASIPNKKSIECILRLYFGVQSGERALKLASDSYERFLTAEDIRWRHGRR